jgi:hypothetical protein
MTTVADKPAIRFHRHFGFLGHANGFALRL